MTEERPALLVTQLSFLACLQGQFSGLIGCERFSGVTWLWPIYLALSDPSDENFAFRYLFQICEKTVRDIEIISMDSYLESGYMGLPTTSNEPPDMTPVLMQGSKSGEITKYLTFLFQMIQFWSEVSRINNFLCIIGHIFRRLMWKSIKIDAYLRAFIQRFRCTPSIDDITWQGC